MNNKNLKDEYKLKIYDDRTIEVINEYGTTVIIKSREDENFEYPAIQTLNQFIDNLKRRIDRDIPSEEVIENLEEIDN